MFLYMYIKAQTYLAYFIYPSLVSRYLSLKGLVFLYLPLEVRGVTECLISCSLLLLVNPGANLQREMYMYVRPYTKQYVI